MHFHVFFFSSQPFALKKASAEEPVHPPRKQTKHPRKHGDRGSAQRLEVHQDLQVPWLSPSPISESKETWSTHGPPHGPPWSLGWQKAEASPSVFVQRCFSLCPLRSFLMWTVTEKSGGICSRRWSSVVVCLTFSLCSSSVLVTSSTARSP